jgi:uncharacterized protein
MAVGISHNIEDERGVDVGVGVDAGGGVRPQLGVAARVGLMALRFYKAYLSVLFAGQCRFVPSCSQYSYEAVERFGLARGSWLTLKRLLRCHPFSGKFGFDPVPDCCGDDGDRVDGGERPVVQRNGATGAVVTAGNFEGQS